MGPPRGCRAGLLAILLRGQNSDVFASVDSSASIGPLGAGRGRRAAGELLDTLLVRSVLVPALVYDIGPKIWLPSRLARR